LIKAIGLGGSTPATVAGTCNGSGQVAALDSCLQTDRRVEVKVVGTR
jgi:outer membrane protein OmpA-like peptidoglycan-associated protein